MKWLHTASKGSRMMFDLKDGDKDLLTLTLDSSTGSVRLQNESEKRAFFIYNEGKEKNKASLLNEYGIQLAALSYRGEDVNDGIIDLNNEQFHFSLRNDEIPEFVIYNHSDFRAIVTCILPIEVGDSTPAISSTLSQALLLSLCWYTLTPVINNMQLQYVS